MVFFFFFTMENKIPTTSKEWTAIDWRNGYDIYMLFIAVFGKAFVVVQTAKILNTKESDSVSLMAYLIYYIVNVSWFFFGLKKKEVVIILSSLTGMLVAGIILTVIVSYKTKKSDIW